MKLAAACLMALMAVGVKAQGASDAAALADQVCLERTGARVVRSPGPTPGEWNAPNTVIAGCPHCMSPVRDRPPRALRSVGAGRARKARPSRGAADSRRHNLRSGAGDRDILGVTHPYTFNGRNLSEMLQGHCLVSDRGRGAFAGARDFRVRCGDQGVLVTKACNATPCRLYPAQFDDAE